MRPNLDVKQLNGKGEAGTSGIYNDVDRNFFKKKGLHGFCKRHKAIFLSTFTVKFPLQVGDCWGPEPPWRAPPCREDWWATWAAVREGQDCRVQHTHLDGMHRDDGCGGDGESKSAWLHVFFIAGSQWLGAPWIQGGDLRPICDRPRPLRPARVCVDSAQKQRGLGNQLIVKLRGQIREKIFFQQCLSLYLQPRDPNNNPQTSKTQDLTFGSCHPVLVDPLKLCEW